MDQWRARLRIERGQIQLRVSSKEARDESLHRLARPMFLEGVAPLEPKQLSTAAIAAADCRNLQEPDLFGDERWADGTQLAQFCGADPGRQRQSPGVDDLLRIRARSGGIW